jgi:hypothetical protein
MTSTADCGIVAGTSDFQEADAMRRRSYETFLPGNIERFCEYWGRGYRG